MHDCLTAELFKKCDSGELGEVELSRMKEHLAACLECRTAYHQWRSSSPVASAEMTQVVGRMADQGSSPSQKFAQSLPQIEGYRIAGILGQGGMGVVYRAVQTKLNRVVALKLLPTIVASPQAVSRFRREAKAAARLHHTNIVPIYDFGDSREGYFYAMELIEGQPLNDLIKKFAEQNITMASQSRVATVLHRSVSGTPVPAMVEGRTDNSPSSAGNIDSSSSTGKGRVYYHQVARWMADAADALHYAHNEGVIHRDIKPGNMILSGDARIMITDFGLAKCSDDESVTVPGVFMGAIRYVSPEQAMAGRVRVDRRTDIYSLGATMYELLALQPAFPGTDDKEILAAIIARDPTPLRKLVPTLPAELETICQKTLEKLPESRYDTARDLAEDLRRFLNDLPIAAKRPGLIRRCTKFIKRNRALVTAIVAVVLLALSSGLIWYQQEKGRANKLESLTSAAELFENERNWAAASAAWRDALNIDGQNPLVLSRLARSIQQLHDRLDKPDPAMVAEAIAFCEKSRALKPDPKLENLYGVLLAMGGHYEEALGVFNKDLAQNEKAPWAWLNVAGVYFLQENDEEVRKALAKSVEYPLLNNEPYCYGHREMATFLLLHKNPAALDALKKAEACEGRPLKHFSYHLIRARVLLMLGSEQDAKDAKYAAENASSHWDEKDPYVERYLSLAYLRNHEPGKALEGASRAQRAGDLSVYVHLLTACALAHLGNRELAKKAIDEADTAWPEDLKSPGDNRRSLHLGILWFESADELHALRREVEPTLANPP